jgi:uncharacterized RDD family membrane protein YckC
MQTIKIQTSQNIELEYELAGTGIRLLAYLIDFAIYVGYGLLLLLLANAGVPIAYDRWTTLLWLLPIFFYQPTCELLLNGQSLGKRVMEVKVISLDGAQASTGQYMIRWLFRLVDDMMSFGLYAIISITVTEKAQRLGDVLAGTTVIRTRQKTRMEDTIFLETYVAYEPKYPAVVQLTDADIALVKEVLNRHYKAPNYGLVVKTAEKICSVLNIPIQNYDAAYFLNDIIRDYNHLTSLG